MISKCYLYNLGVLSTLPCHPHPPKKNIPAKHYVLSKRYLLKANGCKLIFLKWSIDMHCECLISRYFHKFRTNRGRRLGAACRKRGGVKTILKSWLLCHIIFEKQMII